MKLKTYWETKDYKDNNYSLEEYEKKIMDEGRSKKIGLITFYILKDEENNEVTGYMEVDGEFEYDDEFLEAFKRFKL